MSFVGRWRSYRAHGKICVHLRQCRKNEKREEKKDLDEIAAVVHVPLGVVETN